MTGTRVLIVDDMAQVRQDLHTALLVAADPGPGNPTKLVVPDLSSLEPADFPQRIPAVAIFVVAQQAADDFMIGILVQGHLNSCPTVLPVINDKAG